MYMLTGIHTIYLYVWEYYRWGGNQMSNSTLTALKWQQYLKCATPIPTVIMSHMKNQCRILILMTTTLVDVFGAKPKTTSFSIATVLFSLSSKPIKTWFFFRFAIWTGERNKCVAAEGICLLYPFFYDAERTISFLQYTNKK